MKFMEKSAYYSKRETIDTHIFQQLNGEYTAGIAFKVFAVGLSLIVIFASISLYLQDEPEKIGSVLCFLSGVCSPFLLITDYRIKDKKLFRKKLFGKMKFLISIETIEEIIIHKKPWPSLWLIFDGGNSEIVIDYHNNMHREIEALYKNPK